ncbi:cell division cycle protein 20 homolog B isoform X1 [Podarcis raffonei]|uniref:cell division cycle protein 20 homolog B isoform X1 n=2 Tax=Podarcis raffonei TaxID=65483 RepID=UPI0023297E92|nr:cell division cycle protein 20 homolog B isoform X1 [Podarcis raffonei]XP_053264288.1 cell division cycle protein 20 homolog B isoform X1 [Podarcis raffonei]
MEWKLERFAARKVKTDESVLWEKIMRTLGTNLQQTRNLSLQILAKDMTDTKQHRRQTSQVDDQYFPITETPGKTSYSHFKSCLVKKLASSPVASSPISTRWQQSCSRNQVEQSFAESPTTSDDGPDLMKIMTVPSQCTEKGDSLKVKGLF